MAVAGLALGPEGASAFALFPEPPGTGSPADLLELAARWSSVTGLDDGLQVGVAPGVASALQVSGDELASVEQAIVRGIQAWESPVLGFDITLEAAGTVEGPDSGFEIDVFAVPDSHPVFVANPQAFGGLVIPSLSFFDDRPLTNGRASAGLGITGADVYFNIDNFQLLAPFGPARLDILTRITIHEFGHTLGLGHPNESQNFDTNTDPFDSMTIDPGDPFAGIIFSSNIDSTTIMSNEPCGPNPTEACPAVFFTWLGNDERGGRDVLYPVPEPTSGGLLGVGLLPIGGWRSLARIIHEG